MNPIHDGTDLNNVTDFQFFFDLKDRLVADNGIYTGRFERTQNGWKLLHEASNLQHSPRVARVAIEASRWARRNTKCRCSDRQLDHVGCECEATRNDIEEAI